MIENASTRAPEFSTILNGIPGNGVPDYAELLWENFFKEHFKFVKESDVLPDKEKNFYFHSFITEFAEFKEKIIDQTFTERQDTGEKFYDPFIEHTYDITKLNNTDQDEMIRLSADWRIFLNHQDKDFTLKSQSVLIWIFELLKASLLNIESFVFSKANQIRHPSRAIERAADILRVTSKQEAVAYDPSTEYESDLAVFSELIGDANPFALDVTPDNNPLTKRDKANELIDNVKIKDADTALRNAIGPPYSTGSTITFPSPTTIPALMALGPLDPLNARHFLEKKADLELSKKAQLLVSKRKSASLLSFDFLQDIISGAITPFKDALEEINGIFDKHGNLISETIVTIDDFFINELFNELLNIAANPDWETTHQNNRTKNFRDQVRTYRELQQAKIGTLSRQGGQLDSAMQDTAGLLKAVSQLNGALMKAITKRK